tara:strand:- start:243 stop:617 length:375 start_codon:yes stop_codon:yes gene_type:complete
MGRHYSGDIDGKFQFAVQSSNDADFFGVEGYRPERLEYTFEKEDLPKVTEGIKKCKAYLVDWKPKLDEFFKDTDAYSPDDLAKFLKVSETKMQEIQRWDARLDLGKQIEKCIEKIGQCYFEAEL